MDRGKIISRVVFGIIISLPITLTFLTGFALGRRSALRSLQKDTPVEEPEQEQVTVVSAPDTEEVDDEPSVEYVYYRKSMMPLGKTFADLPEKHMEAAQKYGLKSIPMTRTDVNHDRLVKIESCNLYEVDELTHSIPYLTKGAATELVAIATAFQRILSEHNLPKYKIVVTSVLRTQEDAKKLRKSGNVNASTNSAHCFAATFDISYVHFEKADDDRRMMDNYELKKVLAEALLKEKEAGNIYVKYERKQPCFHTTVRK